jgi:membrane carboxypeptidase/penicillin-binding protein
MPVGSSIKPIAVYAPAIENGKNIGSVYYDYAMPIEGWDSAKGYPANNSRSYSGLVTMRKAFVNSLNTSAAQALLYDVGIENSYNTLVNLGVKPEHISKTGSGLALGSSGITPLEMAGAFSAIANMGVYVEPIAFTKILDKNGNVVIDMIQCKIRSKINIAAKCFSVACGVQGLRRERCPAGQISGHCCLYIIAASCVTRGCLNRAFRPLGGNDKPKRRLTGEHEPDHLSRAGH